MNERRKVGMNGGSLPLMRQVTSERRIYSDANRFMRDAALAGVLVVGTRAEVDETTLDALESVEGAVEAPVTAETVSKPAGELATSAAALLDTDVSEELIEEINSSVAESTTV